MATFNLPLSGAVTQAINPWTAYFHVMGSQFGLVNINLGNSSNPDVEAAVLDDVASYGKQLGRMGDVLEVLIQRLDPKTLNTAEKKALADFSRMLADIKDVKNRVQHQQAAIRVKAS